MTSPSKKLVKQFYYYDLIELSIANHIKHLPVPLAASMLQKENYSISDIYAILHNIPISLKQRDSTFYYCSSCQESDFFKHYHDNYSKLPCITNFLIKQAIFLILIKTHQFNHLKYINATHNKYFYDDYDDSCKATAFSLDEHLYDNLQQSYEYNEPFESPLIKTYLFTQNKQFRKTHLQILTLDYFLDKNQGKVDLGDVNSLPLVKGFTATKSKRK